MYDKDLSEYSSVHFAAFGTLFLTMFLLTASTEGTQAVPI